MRRFAVDASVLVAISKGEPEATGFVAFLADEPWLIGTPSLLEWRIWTIRNPGNSHLKAVSAILRETDCQRAAFDEDMEALAADAYRQFGKGRHPARLNFGDCMAYAVARHHDIPLLFKGNDFALTDIKIHPASTGGPHADQRR